MSQWARQRCIHIALLVLAVAGNIPSSYARTDILDQPVSLATEADLVQAVSATLQHALVTTQQFKPRSASLKRFARQEIKARRKGLTVLTKRSGTQAPQITHLAIVPSDDQQYVRAMSRNHSRLLELLEYGLALALSPDIKRLMKGLSQSIQTELTTLNTMARSNIVATSHQAAKAVKQA